MGPSSQFWAKVALQNTLGGRKTLCKSPQIAESLTARKAAREPVWMGDSEPRRGRLRSDEREKEDTEPQEGV